MAGRRLPNNVHALRGTKQKSRHGENDGPILTGGFPQMTDEVKADPRAVKHWNKIKKIMEPTGIYTEADADALSQYCLLWVEFAFCPSEFPSAKLAQMRLTRKDLYLDPESRAKLGGKKASNKNPFESL